MTVTQGSTPSVKCGQESDTILKHILKHNDLGSSTGTFSTSASVFQYGNRQRLTDLVS
jgi:hypothetical protein